MATLFIISLASSEPTHTLTNSPSFSRSLARSLALHFTFSSSRFNNRPSSSNQGIVEPSEVTWLSKLSLSISQMYTETLLPGALEWACSQDMLLAVYSSSSFVLIYPPLYFFFGFFSPEQSCQRALQAWC